MKVTVCDICGGKIEDEAKWHRIIQIPIAGKDADGMYGYMLKFEDLCEKCILELGQTTAEKYYAMLREHKGEEGVAASRAKEENAHEFGK